MYVRSVLRGGGLLLVALAISSCASTAEEGGAAPTGPPSGDATLLPRLNGRTITFIGFGGEQQEAQADAWLKPFAKATGAQVKQDTSFDNAKVEAQVEAHKVIWDLQQNFSFFVSAECGKLFQPLKSVDTSQLQPDLLTNDCGIPISPLASVLAYDANAYDTPPTSLRDFFDMAKFPGKRVIYSSPFYNLEAALLGDGVPADQLYPLDVGRAYHKLDGIRNNLIIVGSPTGPAEKIAAGEATMGLVFSARGYSAAKAYPGLKPVWNQAVFDWDNLAILKGAPNADVAEQLLSFIAKPSQQAAFASSFPYGVTTKNTDVKLDELARAWWVNEPANQTGRVNLSQRYWAAHQRYKSLSDQWTAWAQQ